MRFSIAGLKVSFDGSARRALPDLEADWQPFATTDETEGITLSIDVTGPVARPQGWLPLSPAIHPQADGSLELAGDGFRAQISSDRRHGVVHQPAERFPLEVVVRVLLAESVWKRGGLLVHGVALAHRDQAALFTGVSGAGKSTLAAWASRGGLSLLADELVAVLPEGDGFTVHGTPWNLGAPLEARLALVGILTHAADARLSPVPPSSVLRVLLSNVLEPADTPAVRAKLFQIAGRLLGAVPSRELAFAPDVEVAAVLREALASR